MTENKKIKTNYSELNNILEELGIIEYVEYGKYLPVEWHELKTLRVEDGVQALCSVSVDDLVKLYEKIKSGANEAIKELKEKYETLERLSDMQDKAIVDLTKTCKERREQIEKMKKCGNCKRFHRDCKVYNAGEFDDVPHSIACPDWQLNNKTF